MNKKINSFLTVVLITTIFITDFLRAETLDEVVSIVEKKHRDANDLFAHFKQSSYIKSLRNTIKASGLVYFKKPGMMRWDYQEGEKQLIISDGKSLWIYTPKSKQVIVEELTRTFQSKTPINYLSGFGNLREDFNIRFLEDGAINTRKNFILELIPKTPQGNIAKLHLIVDKDVYYVTGITTFDFFDNRNELQFSKIKINEGLKDSLFKFRIPKGVEVIRPPGSIIK